MSVTDFSDGDRMISRFIKFQPAISVFVAQLSVLCMKSPKINPDTVLTSHSSHKFPSSCIVPREPVIGRCPGRNTENCRGTRRAAGNSPQCRERAVPCEISYGLREVFCGMFCPATDNGNVGRLLGDSVMTAARPKSVCARHGSDT